MMDEFQRGNYSVWRAPERRELICWDRVTRTQRTVAVRALEALIGGHGSINPDEVFSGWPMEAAQAVAEFYGRLKASQRKAAEDAKPHNRISRALNLPVPEALRLLEDLPYCLQVELATEIESLPQEAA